MRNRGNMINCFDVSGGMFVMFNNGEAHGLVKWFIAGIFAFLNFLAPHSRQEIIQILINGLKRLEYRGYDSAGKQNFNF
jgi:hypothetical protein